MFSGRNLYDINTVYKIKIIIFFMSNVILKFDDFINESAKVGHKPVNKVKSVKEYNEAVKNGYVKLREDYIHSFIDEHERDVEPEEE